MVNLRAHAVGRAVVPQFPNLFMNPLNIIVTHHNFVGGGFDACVPTFLNDILRKSWHTIITDMVETAGKAYGIKSAGAECPCLGLLVPITWRDDWPPQDDRIGRWGGGRCWKRGIDATGGGQNAVTARCLAANVSIDARGGAGINATRGGQNAVAARCLAANVSIDARGGAAGWERPREGGLAEVWSLMACG